MTFPLLFEVQHLEYDATAKDELGNVAPGWADPVVRKVYGWGPPETTEPGPGNRAGLDLGTEARLMVDVELLVPPGFPAARQDRFILDGDLYEANGSVQHLNHNPFGWNPGGTVALRRVEG